MTDATNINQQNLPQADLKTCKGCGGCFEATNENFYNHRIMKDGLSSQCKNCVNARNRLAAQKAKEKDPEGFAAKARERSNRFYKNNPERAKEIGRNSAKKRRDNPAKRAEINARKRAGGKHKMSMEELEELFQSQGCKCAICGTTEPQDKTGSKGWNVDHCHSTNKVRFILCNHCNRGLGAFKDSPELLRKAAKLLKDV